MKHAKQIELYCAILCQTTQKGTKRAQNDKPKNVLGQSSFWWGRWGKAKGVGEGGIEEYLVSPHTPKIHWKWAMKVMLLELTFLGWSEFGDFQSICVVVVVFCLFFPFITDWRKQQGRMPGRKPNKIPLVRSQNMAILGIRA
jgi:hypothetical protein